MPANEFGFKGETNSETGQKWDQNITLSGRFIRQQRIEGIRYLPKMD